MLPRAETEQLQHWGELGKGLSAIALAMTILVEAIGVLKEAVRILLEAV
jgi:hypothetical protein